MDSKTTAPNFVVYREHAGRVGGALRRIWAKRWAKVLAALLALPVIGVFLAWLIFAQGLPSAESLLTYQPPLPTNIRGIDGEPAQTFARERRTAPGVMGKFPRLLPAPLS